LSEAYSPLDTPRLFQVEVASGAITNHDEITVILIESNDGTPPLVRVHWPLRATTATASHYPAVAAAIVRIIAESATALAGHKARGQR
jgi:hypothetical protein